MNDWHPPVEYLTQLVFRRNILDLKLAIIALVAIIFFIVVFKIGAKAVGLNRDSWFRVLLASFLSMLVPSLAVFLAHVYLVPVIPPNVPEIGVIAGCALVAILIMIIPLMSLFLRGTSIQVFLVLLFSFVAFFVSIRLSYGVDAAIQNGSLGFGKAKTHSDAIKTISSE